MNEDQKVQLSKDDFAFVAQLVRDTAAIVLEPEKVHLVESRLVPVVRREGFDSIGALVQAVRESTASPLGQKVVEAMTTNETSFFRDVSPFRALRDHVLPELIASRAETRQLNVWCAASSTGQEPYTVAMIIRDGFPELRDWQLSFVATDISSAVMDRAREGFYSQLEINRGLPARMLVRYFEQVGAEWRVKDALRSMVDFRQLNLIGEWPSLPRFDLVFVRNVFIYFDTETKKKVLTNMKATMAQDAFLFLGNAETTLSIDDDFKRVKFDRGACYRRMA